MDRQLSHFPLFWTKPRIKISIIVAVSMGIDWQGGIAKAKIIAGRYAGESKKRRAWASAFTHSKSHLPTGVESWQQLWAPNVLSGAQFEGKDWTSPFNCPRNNLMYKASWISVLRTFLVAVIGLLLNVFTKHGRVLKQKKKKHYSPYFLE